MQPVKQKKYKIGSVGNFTSFTKRTTSRPIYRTRSPQKRCQPVVVIALRCCLEVGRKAIIANMALLWTVVSVSFSIIITPFLMFLLAIIFLASIGKSLGVRRLYVKILLKIFEYGRQHIEIAKKDQRREMVTGSSCEGDGDADADATEDEGAASASTAASVERAAGVAPAGAGAGAGADAGAGDAAHAPVSRRPSPGGGAKAPACNGSAGALLPNGALPNSLGVISREDLILSPVPSLNSANGAAKEGLPRSRSFETLKREFELADCLEFVKAGVEAIIEDEVTLRFEAEELKSWNLLTRTNSWYEFISWRLTVIWVLGFLVRYCFLLPLRVLICFIGVMWLTFCTGIVGYVPEGQFKRWLNYRVNIMCFGILSSALSSVITYHNPENRPKNGICVANHTSPIDVLVLACDNCYALIGQRHGGFLGVLQRALARASPHIWFERSEVKDREAVAKRLRQHVSDPKNPPILIFPEGTCINNTSVMQFKKGSFEVGGVIYPVAIKYDPKFGDAFWNSSRFSMMQYLYMMMTSWAIVCDVWYLPPMYQKEGETAIDFANRVKSCIARQGGLVDLMWDGQLKRMKAKKEWKEAQQEEYSKRLKLE
ncbi:AGPAT6_1 protein [Gryllus bimaculatus]|nr:AGPAT6_1 protein [Gryllus bimaculatus]